MSDPQAVLPGLPPPLRPYQIAAVRETSAASWNAASAA